MDTPIKSILAGARKEGNRTSKICYGKVAVTDATSLIKILHCWCKGTGGGCLLLTI